MSEESISTPNSSATEAPLRKMSFAIDLLRQSVRWFRLAKIRAKLRKKFQYGNNVGFGPGADLRPPTLMTFGNNVYVGKELTVETDLVVGDDVLISARVSCVGNDHRFDDPQNSIFWSGRLPPSKIVIEGDNLIGYGVTIVGNVRIGKGCVVGAGAVVTRDLPPNMICVGIPARPIKNRFE